jgi:hypothetical protein
MKKLLALVSLLVIAACAPPTNNNADVGTNRAANSNTEISSAPVLSEADAIAKEKAIWDTIKNKDYAAFGNMLADDQVEVSAEGVHDKAQSITMVKEFEPTEITFSDWKFLPIDKDAVVLTYTVNLKGKFKGKEFPPANVRASSAWVNRGGKWLAVYHQECDVAKAMPPATAKSPAKKEATPAASASASPLTLGSDALANEKAIWEAIKTKNYDGFASALAPNSIEVEPTGVYDKAGSVKGVMQLDASKVELSEFKATPFDADAALVIYTVKFPGPAPAETHSTIWSRRDGKWFAVFHHGTPVAKAPAASASPAKK